MCDQQQYTTDSVFLNRLGFAPGVNGGASPGPEESPAMPAPKQEGSAAQAGHRLAALTGWAAQGGPVDPTALRQGALGRGSPVP